MTFAIKAKVTDPLAETFAFSAQKTMYGGKRVAKGDAIFVFASENEGGPGLIASGIVTSSKSTPKKRGIPRQTPRVSITIKRSALAKHPFGPTRKPRHGVHNPAVLDGNKDDCRAGHDCIQRDRGIG